MCSASPEHVLNNSKPSRKAGLIAKVSDNLDAEQKFSCQMANKARPDLKLPRVAAWKKNQTKSGKANKLLLTVNVLGNPGPLRFLVYSHDTVKRVIQLALKAYASEGRVPVLGINYKTVELCCANNDFEALGLNQPAGRLGTRNFLLHKKKQETGNTQERRKTSISFPVKFWTSMMNTFICYS
ncbi:hypothetical protein O6H91_07G057200 [Diphasiastrum complanatum]|uniref:Uncharacterized protein n=1 Tax=Diphasiastrum complanatum TaxID=34168 RepID=A0ACC2D5Q0_DIPCM|nr:hypothetical protein O6H91_07G057200 [Diphasiastrum complanatum]